MLYYSFMRTLIILVLIVVTPITYWLSVSYFKFKISKQLIKDATPFTLTNNDVSKKLLVLGDSTAVGVGAENKEESVPGRMAEFLQSTYVENKAVSGATVEDLSNQVESLAYEKYDVILLQIGANDITRFHRTESVVEKLESIIEILKTKTDKIIFISAGNVGGAPFLPPPLRPFYTKLNLRYHAAFEELSKKHGVTYVNLYEDPKTDSFLQEPNTYFAGDSFHPSGAGYGIWFEKIKSTLDAEKK